MGKGSLIKILSCLLTVQLWDRILPWALSSFSAIFWTGRKEKTWRYFFSNFPHHLPSSSSSPLLHEFTVSDEEHWIDLWQYCTIGEVEWCEIFESRINRLPVRDWTLLDAWCRDSFADLGFHCPQWLSTAGQVGNPLYLHKMNETEKS